MEVGLLHEIIHQVKGNEGILAADSRRGKRCD
jgi:hypothetical protein